MPPEELIRERVNIKGFNLVADATALIDTAAQRTLIPRDMAKIIGVTYHGEIIEIGGIGDSTIQAERANVTISFPNQDNLSYTVEVGVTDQRKDVVIGIDTLKIIRGHVDTANKKLYIKNELAELVVGGLAVIGVVLIFKTFFDWSRKK